MTEDEQNQLKNLRPLPDIKGVNSQFFESFGHPDFPKFFLAESTLLMVRSGLSWEEEFADKRGKMIRYPDARITDEMIYNKLWDSQLSLEGEKQAKKL